MFSFFKKKKKSDDTKDNKFLDVQNAAFNTSNPESTRTNSEVPSLVYQPPKVNVPAYKASNTNDLGIVIDTEQVGFNVDDINSNLKTIDLFPQKKEEESNLGFSSESPLIQSNPEPIPTEKVLEPLPELHHNIEIIELNEKDASISPSEDVGGSNVNNTNIVNEERDEFTIFGSQDGPAETKSFSANYYEEVVDLDKNVKMTPDGHKICPNCGAILKPEAPVCFMCSKSFILKK